MSRRVIETITFDDADGCHNFLEELLVQQKWGNSGVLYIENADGSILEKVEIVERTLSDGSTTRDLVFHF